MASSIEQLLSLSDEAFIRRAYANVLGCDPDPVGLNSHLALIRSGESRLAILAMLRLSEEGRLRGRNLAGLDRVVRLYRWRRLPLIGPILRLTDRRRDRVDVLDKLIVIETKLDYLARLVPSSGITGSLDESAGWRRNWIRPLVAKGAGKCRLAPSPAMEIRRKFWRCRRFVPDTC